MTGWFDAEYLHHGITWIDERHVSAAAAGNIWLLDGETEDLVIDTGCGVRDLNSYTKTLTRKSYSAVATVGYFDHVRGLNQFSETAIHRADVHRVASPDLINSVWWKYMTPERFSEKPFEELFRRHYAVQPHNPSRLLDEGDVIEFGTRRLEVVHLPGVIDGSIGLFEQEYGILFTGDFLLDTDPAYLGEPADETDDADGEAFRQSLARVAAVPIQEVFPGHGSPYDATRPKIVIHNCVTDFGAR